MRLWRLAGVFIAVVMAGGVSLHAHDMWIEPSAFSPASGAIVSVRLRVGQDFIGDPLPRDPALIKVFDVEDAEGRRPLVGRTGADPAGLLRVVAPGLALITYHSHPSRVELTGEKFAQYLEEEGLHAVAALRAKRGETGGVKEMFSRCAKSLLRTTPACPVDPVGDIARARRDKSTGCTIELVADQNPYTMAAGDTLPLHLTYENRPLAGALVVAMNRDNPTEKVSARTDTAGRVRLRLPRGGMWMVKAVHMIPAAFDSGAEWESFWASLTFDLPNLQRLKPENSSVR